MNYQLHKEFSAHEEKTGLLCKLMNLVWGAQFLIKNGLPNQAFRFGGGLGDHLLCTALFLELAKRGITKSWMLSHYPALFQNNPHQLKVVKDNWKVLKFLERMGRPSTLLHYGKWIGEIDRIAPPKKHIITEILLKGGITGKVSIRPYWFGDTKSTTIRTQKPYFCVQSTNTHSSTPMLNKKWQEDKMIAVLNSLSSKYDIVQLGVNEEPRFKSTIDARNSSISDSSAILANSEFFIGQVGFLMHLARAVNTRSIIIYGGREKAWQSGYPCNENLETNPNCSPCWQNNQCEYNRKCLSDISVAQVLQAVDRIELRKPTEMETEIVDI